MELIGYAGSILLGVCAVPLAWDTHRKGYDNTNGPFLYTWFLGDVCMLYHVIANVPFDGPLILNYSFNTLLLLIILKNRFFPRSTNE